MPSQAILRQFQAQGVRNHQIPQMFRGAIAQSPFVDFHHVHCRPYQHLRPPIVVDRAKHYLVPPR